MQTNDGMGDAPSSSFGKFESLTSKGDIFCPGHFIATWAFTVLSPYILEARAGLSSLTSCPGAEQAWTHVS